MARDGGTARGVGSGPERGLLLEVRGQVVQ